MSRSESFEHEMIEESPPSFVFRCDSCGRTERTESREAPPPGFGMIVSQARKGIIETAHACLNVCLVRMAMKLAGALQRRP